MTCSIQTFSQCDLEVWASIVASTTTVLGILIALVGAVFAYKQIKATKEISKGEFMLLLEQIISRYDAVHLRLRPGGDWAKPGAGPKSGEEWDAVDDYMGFFEHCELLIQAGTLDQREFQTLYGYRVHNLLANENIVSAKLNSQEKELWTVFLALCKRLEHRV